MVETWLIDTLDKLLTSLDLVDMLETWLMDLTRVGTSSTALMADGEGLAMVALLLQYCYSWHNSWLYCHYTWVCSSWT